MYTVQTVYTVYTVYTVRYVLSQRQMRSHGILSQLNIVVCQHGFVVTQHHIPLSQLIVTTEGHVGSICFDCRNIRFVCYNTLLCRLPKHMFGHNTTLQPMSHVYVHKSSFHSSHHILYIYIYIEFASLRSHFCSRASSKKFSESAIVAY